MGYVKGHQIIVSPGSVNTSNEPCDKDLTNHCKRGGLSSGGGIKESDREGTSLTSAETIRDWV